MGVVEFSFFWL